MAGDHENKLEEEGEKAVDDVIDFFTDEGEDDSPTSDADAPPPG